MERVAVAAAFALGLEVPKALLLVGLVIAPMPMAAVLAVFYWRQRRTRDSRTALFCEGVASELRSGANLGHALVAAANSVDEPTLRHLDPSMAVVEIADLVADAYPEIGSELKATISAAFRGGSQSADLFEEIGSLAIAQSEVSREVQVASAPARATAAVFVGAPTLYLIFQARSDRLVRLFAYPEQRVVAIVGLALFSLGLLIASLLAWRAR